MQIYLSQTTDFGNHFTLLRDVLILLVLQTPGSGADPGFFKVGGGGGGGWYLGVAESMGHAPKCCNLRTGLNLKLLTRHTSNTTNEKLL